MLKIQNRRYIGNKTKMLESIYEAASEAAKSVFTDFGKNTLVFADLFAGTGVVSQYFADRGFDVIINDFLYSNYVPYKAWFNNSDYSNEKIQQFIDKYNTLEYKTISSNYFSDIYSNKYFSENDAKKIGYIREDIENQRNNLTEREYYILLSTLIYTVDRIANTVGHFEHYLKEIPQDTHFKLKYLELKKYSNIEIYNEDTNILAKRIESDITYLDPPYNARQYINFYHVLENLARWDKPNEFEGISMKFKRDHLKSGYSKSIAKTLMTDLIDSIKSKIIIVSYNNTYNAKSGASNNKISETEMLDILLKKGSVEIIEIPYDYFNAGKTNFNGHLEKLFVCKVARNNENTRLLFRTKQG